MRVELHPADSRGRTQIDWLNSWHSFSFGNYHNPGRMSFGLLRVLNDDIIAAGKGFGAHPHDNMEIITIALEGELAHRDSGGNAGVIRPGDVQVMSAGSGIEHSEFNNSKTKAASILQIWIETKEQDIKPRYEQKNFEKDDRKNKFLPIASGMKHKGALYIHQDAVLSLASLKKDKELEYVPAKAESGRGIFLFVIEGRIKVAGVEFGRRDALGISSLAKLKISALKDAELLVIEVPMAR